MKDSASVSYLWKFSWAHVMLHRSVTDIIHLNIRANSLHKMAEYRNFISGFITISLSSEVIPKPRPTPV